MKYIITKKGFSFPEMEIIFHTPQTYMFNTNQTTVYSFLFLNIKNKDISKKGFFPRMKCTENKGNIHRNNFKKILPANHFLAGI